MLLSQDFGFTDTGEIQLEDDLCLDVSSRSEGTSINILNCHGLGGNQKWAYNNEVGNLLFDFFLAPAYFCRVSS